MESRSIGPPRRVLLTTDATGGVWRHSIELARALRERGIACLLAVFGPEPSDRQLAELGDIPWIWTGAPLDWMVEDEAELAPVTDILITIARRWQADLLHLNQISQAAGLPRDLTVAVAAHSCVPSWWHAVQGGELPLPWRWQWRHNRQGLDRADVVLAPTASHGELLEEVYGKLSTLRVVSDSTPAPPELPAKEPFVLSVGWWWDPGKNGAVLDRAAARLPWPLVMAGPLSGPGGERVAFAHAKLTGALPPDEVLGLMERAALFAAPSRYEPFGLSVLEAAHRGCALVLADTPGFRELWNSAACFVPADDAEAWDAALAGLAADTEQCRMLSSRARARAKHFSPWRQEQALLVAYSVAAARHAIPYAA